MKELKLTQGRVAFVDDEDFEWASQYSWHVTNGYAARAVWKGGRRTFYLHREVASRMGVGMVDHRNRNRLDCTRLNLRPASYSVNNGNVPPSGASGVLGVDACKGKWRARVKRQGRTHQRSGFETVAEAEAWVMSKRRELDGD